MMQIRSPNSEIRNPAVRDEIRSPNFQKIIRTRARLFRIPDFGLLSSFVIRHSDFPT
jgi:hypothetical protein